MHLFFFKAVRTAKVNFEKVKKIKLIGMGEVFWDGALAQCSSVSLLPHRSDPSVGLGINRSSNKLMNCLLSGFFFRVKTGCSRATSYFCKLADSFLNANRQRKPKKCSAKWRTLWRPANPLRTRGCRKSPSWLLNCMVRRGCWSCHCWKKCFFLTVEMNH